MRAERHYVDQVASSSADQPVRMLAPSQLDGDAVPSTTNLRALIESIRARGIVHPLLVRRREARFVVIAGHKRLEAARTLRLAAVPCLVRDIDDVEGRALAAADNLVVDMPAERPDGFDLQTATRALVTHHLTSIRTCGDLLASGSPALTRSVVDLIRAHAWRAERLADALDLIGDVPLQPGRERPLAVIADEVLTGFEPESRLNGFALHSQLRDHLSSSGLSGHDLLAGVSGAVLAVLPLLEPAVRPSLLIKASSAGSASVVIEVTQADVPVSSHLARDFFENTSSDRLGGPAAVVGAMAARALASRYGGTATFEVVPEGCTLRMVLARRS